MLINQSYHCVEWYIDTLLINKLTSKISHYFYLSALLHKVPKVVSARCCLHKIWSAQSAQSASMLYNYILRYKLKILRNNY